MQILGIDVGGSGMKGAIVDTKKGELVTERFRIPTPQPATPKAMAKVAKEICEHFDWKGPVGCGFPSIIINGECKSHGNIDPSWVGTDVEKLFSKASGCDFSVINDADAAGLAEMRFGSGKDKKGSVIMLTIGTGLGSGLFYNGNLIPNIEAGYLLYKKDPIEWWASEKAKKTQDLSNSTWGKRIDFFLNYVSRVYSPELIILGGGGSKNWHKLEKHIDVKTPIKLAEMGNLAGIVGAAMCAVR